MRTNGDHLTELLRVRVDDLQDDCLQRALRVAVEVGNHYSVGKLIVKGADNIMEALKLAKEQKQHQVRAMLLLVIAAAEGNRELVLKLFGDYTSKVSQVRVLYAFLEVKDYPLLPRQDLVGDPDFSEVQKAVISGKVSTVVPIEIARRNQQSAVREELLLRTDVNQVRLCVPVVDAVF